ncbi:MAG: M42 family metallopeptidase [Verrucomicrobia bacterium]|nr:M42 family metallopeptidase [Verrucomicrobiota bacterium]
MPATEESALKLLRELTETPAVPSFEDGVRKIVARELQDCGAVAHDRNGSVYCERPSPAGGPRVLVTGHMDEVGFMVQNIAAEGFIQFVPLGGWWTHTLLAQRVNVLTATGESILGVICSTPPHFLSAEARAKVLPIEKLFIDVGAGSREEATGAFGIQVGDAIAPETAFSQMRNPKFLMAKAFDNRVGIGLTIQTLQALRGESLPNALIGLATVQEEVGVRGATTAARATRPDVALVLEGAPADDTPGFNRNDSQGQLGTGVQVRIMDPTAIMSRRLVDFVKEVATENGIPHQLTVRRSGGTDARAIHLSGEGVPTVVLAVPARYIHSHNSIIHIDDYLAAHQLICALVKRLDASVVSGLTQFL